VAGGNAPHAPTKENQNLCPTTRNRTGDSTMKKGCGIIRISDKKSGGKIKSKDTLKSRLTHNLRGESLSTSPRMWHLNKQDSKGIDIIYGGKTVDEVMKRAEKIYDQLDIAPTVGKSEQRNSIHAVEVLCAFSPEMQNKISVALWAEDCLKFLKRHFNENRIISTVVHYDEQTPHLHAVIIPILKKKDGKLRLNAGAWFDNQREKQADGTYKTTENRMEIFQDKYFEAVSKKHGLKRGDKVSSHEGDDTYTPPSHEQIQGLKKRTQAADLFASIKTPQALKDARKEIAGLKRNMNRKLRAARRAGEEAKAGELEVTLSTYKQQVKKLKDEVSNLFDSNVELNSDLDAASQQVEQLSDTNEILLSSQAELIETIRALKNKPDGKTM